MTVRAGICRSRGQRLRFVISVCFVIFFFFFFQAEDGIRDVAVTGVQTCALPISAGITPTPQKKDYFFDGTSGLYQNADNSQVWIFPTMRRGGRMLYAMDVTKIGRASCRERV